MRDYERAMLYYLELARRSQHKAQLIPRDKFLILAGQAACCAGWPDVADHCRKLVLARNKSHLVGRFDTFPDALRSDEFQTFLKQLARFCTFEEAEHLLAGWPPESQTTATLADTLLDELGAEQ